MLMFLDFICGDGHVISDYAFCDGNHDCDDGSDEMGTTKNCSNCDHAITRFDDYL